MLEGYIDFVTSLFPSINPYTQHAAKESLRQFYTHGNSFQCTRSSAFADLNQGDILSDVMFRFYDEDGREMEQILDVVVVSNSCDIENDPRILIAPLLPVADLDLDGTALRNNLYYNFLYFPDIAISDKVADLSLITSYPKKPVEDQIANGKILKKHSLNLVGFYLLISKLTVHLLRPEDIPVQSSRAS